MEEDYEPAVQHQRRVNPKIHDVIKKEVEKLLDARLIYLILDSPWVYMDIFHDMIEKTRWGVKDFMERLFSFLEILSLRAFQLEKMLKRVEDTNLASKLGENHFMVKGRHRS
ncbi:hypothetical protein Tco_0564068 [Tanacetum coccineum]